MQEQEQGLEKKERTIYLSSTGDFVNTDLTNPREIKYASEIQLYNKSRDKFYGLKPMNMSREEITKAALEDTKRGYLRQVGAGLASAGVQMGQELYNFAMFTNPILVAKTKRLLYKRGLDTQKKHNVISEEAYKRQLEELNAEYRGVRDTINADLMANREKQNAYLEKTGLGKKEGDSIVYDIANGFGSAAAALGLAIITKSPNAAVAVFGVNAGQSGYEEALENGIAPEKALKLGGARGFAESLFERVGLHCAFESLAARGVLARIGKTALTEGVQEMSQQTAEEILQTKYGGRKEDFKTAVNNIIFSGFIGAFVGSSFGAVGAGRNAKQGLKDTGKVEIKSPYSITLEDAYFSGVKSLTDLGMPPEDAEKLTFSLLKKAAAPETIKEIQDMIKEENSNLTYLNNDEDQNAAAVKAAIEKATAPDRIVREQAFNIADKVEEEALKAGRAPEEAAASAALEQARAIGMYNLTDVLPRDLYQINIEAESSAENDLSGQEDASFDFGGNMETDTAEIDAFTNMDDLLASLSKEQRTEVLGKVNFDKRLDPLYKEIGEFKAAVNKKIKDGKTLTQYVATEATAEEKATAERLFNEFEQKQLEIAKEFLKEQKTPQTLYQEGIEEKENKPELFKADKQVSENFAREVNESLNNGNPKEKRFFEMGKVPAVYNFVGLPMQDLKTNKLAMRKALGLLTEEELKKDKRLHNHNVPLDVVNRLVDLVAEPIAIFKSNNKEDKNKFVAVLDAKFEDKQIVAILSPNEKQKGFTFIPTAYEKDDFETFVRETSKNKNILYINEEGAKSSGLTLQTNFIEQIAPNNNILTKDEIVKGEFLLVDGKKRAARNSEGNLIHTNLAAIRNFYKWFGDSKVVDEQGRPLVVYHGTSGKFNIFKGVKHFFTDNKDLADAYGSAETMPVYLRAENPLMVDAYKQSFEDIANAKDFKKKQKDLTETDYKKLAKYHNMPVEEIKEFFPKEGDSLVNLARAYGEKSRSTNGWADYAKEKGYDGVIIKDVVDNTGWENADIAATDYIVFEPTQIKSVYNKGTFDEKNPNIYYQDKRGSVSFADDIKQAFIKFNETSDKSTLIHELAHIWLKDIERFAQVSTKPEFLEFKQNLDAWLGEPVDGVYTREQQEKFAKTFEKYMQEGKAPNAELQSIFEKFKEWLQEIYSAVRDYVKLTPEAIKTFDTLLASEKGTYNIDKIRNKTAQAKAVVEKIKKGQAATIDGVNVKDIKEALKVMNARIPAAPKENLLRTLRSKGADYANAAKIDKEAYKNARVPNKKTGIQDNLALTLRDWGYMDFDDSAVDTYDGLVEQNEIAADLIDRAFSGEKVYKVGDQQAAKREQFLADVEKAREIVGESGEEIARAIADLEKKGYRVVEKADIDYLEKQLNQLDKIAEKARLLEQNPEEQKKTEAFEKMQKQHALEARRIKAAVIEELGKRDIVGKDKMFEVLEKAQTPDEIIAAANDILTQLEKEFANTEEGQAEQRKIDIPSTNWEAKRITLLKDLAEISQNASEEIARAREITNQAHLANQGLRPALTKEEAAELDKARNLLKKTFEKKYLKAFSDALRDEPHIESKDVAAIMKVAANNAMEMRLASDYAVKQFIGIAQRKQAANYKKYVKGKIKAVLDLNLFDKTGNLKKALVDPITFNTLQELKHVARLDQKQAADELASRMERFAGQDEQVSPADRIINELLSVKALDEQDISVQLIKKTYDDIHDLRQTGRSARNLQKMIFDYQNEQAKSEVLQAVKKNKEAGWIKRTYASWLANWESMLDVFADKEVKEKYSMLNTEADTITHTWQRRKDIMDGVKRIYNLGSNREVQSKMNELRNEKYTFTNYALVDQGGEMTRGFRRTGEPFKEELNKMQIITAYIYNQNDVLATRLLQQYGKEQLDEMWSKLDMQDKQLANFLQKEAEKSYEQINKVFVKERGYDLPKVDKYFPSITERVESELDFLHASAMMSKNPSFIKMRANAAFVQMKLENPFGILFRHIDRAADYHFKAEKLNEIRRVFKSPVVKPAIIEKVGEDVYKRMLELIDQFSVNKQTLKYDIDKLGDWLTNNYVKGAIALKPTIAIKQLISSMNYAENMPAGKWIKGFTNAVLHPKETIDFMMSGDPYLKARYESGSMNEALARATADANAITAHGKFLRFTDLLSINTRLGDIGAIIFGGKPYVDFLMNEKGMSKQEAFAEFRKSTLRSQQSNTRSSLSTLQARDMNWLIRGLFAFKNTPAQYARKIADGISQYQRGEIDAKQLGKMVAIYGLLNSWMYSMLTTLGVLAWFYDRDEAKELMTDELVFSPFTQMASSLPVLDMAVGQAANVAKAKMFKHRVQMERPEMPVVSEIFKMGSKALKEDVSAEDVLDMLITGGQIFGGLPTQYTKGLYTGGAATISGKNPMRGFLQALGYTENRATKITGEEKKKKKRKRRTRKKKK